jgi:hypothetical protein
MKYQHPLQICYGLWTLPGLFHMDAIAVYLWHAVFNYQSGAGYPKNNNPYWPLGTSTWH